jgi:muramoyltetrapeptide carboxypeptidase LdcA involved in peptidoglycan recycling
MTNTPVSCSAPLVKPRRLAPGDTVMTVSQSWGGPATYPHRYEAGKRQLEAEFGVRVREAPHALRDAAWLKKNSQARADDLLLAFSDPSVAAVISTIGGDDAIRLIRHVDLNVIRDHPKAFLGYSDGTVVNMMCYQAGLVSFYGVCMMVGFAENTGMHRYTADSVRRTLFSTAPPGLVTPHTEGWTDEFLDWADPSHQLRARTLEPPLPRRVLQGQGTVRGRLLGEAYRDLERASYVSQATAACS